MIIGDSYHNNQSNFFLKKGYPLSNDLKTKISLWNYFNKNYFRKKITNKYISFNLNNYLKLNKIPLRYIYIFTNDTYLKNMLWIMKYSAGIIDFYKFVKGWQDKIFYFMNAWKRYSKKRNLKFFFFNFIILMIII